MTKMPLILLAVISLTFHSLAVSAAGSGVDFRKQYVDARYGQIHVLTSSPAAPEKTQKQKLPQKLQTAMACFAPNPAAGRYFRMFMSELGQDRVMIAPDYPGLGESDAPGAVLDMAGYTAAMADTLDALGYGKKGKGPVDVCGYHTGAMVAIELAVTRPDLVRKLLLMGIPYYDSESRKAEYEKYVVDKPIQQDLSGLQGSWDFAVSNRQEGVSLERGYDNFVDVLKAQDRRTWAYHAVFSYPAENRAPLVTQPVLILNTHGGLAKETRAMAPFFPDAKLVEIPELHHGIFDVGPGILAGHARPFLDQP